MGNSQQVAAVPRMHETDGSGDRIFSIDLVRYVAPISEQDRPIEGEPELSLVTAIEAPDATGEAITGEWIRDVVDELKKDDVFQTSFLATVVFATQDGKDADISKDARQFLKEAGATSLRSLPRTAEDGTVEAGPYIVVQGCLRAVWRLYDDTHGTFMTTFRPQSGPFVELQLRGVEDTFFAVAVPSRIGRKRSKEKPLNNLRIAIKDNFHLEGVRSSLGSRSYYNTYDVQPKTAECVQSLIDQGAVVIGKLKLTSLGAWEEPIEATDYQSPWNPRADKFQSPGGSSSGPASAVAAYDWIDVTFGSDTCGSVMRPALWCGTYSLRPSTRAISTEGIAPFIPSLDLPGCFGRNLRALRNLTAHWLDNKQLIEKPKKFTTIVWIADMWGTIDEDQQDIARKFTKDLENNLKIETVDVSIEQRWQDDPPNEAQGSSLSEYTGKASGDLFYEAFHNLDDFVEKHQEKFGVPPYFSPPNAAMWRSMKDAKESDWKEAVEHVDVYKRWFWKNVLDGDNDHKLLVLPIENLSPRYRDASPDFEKPPPGINSLFLSPVMEAPELMVPIGEIPYDSRITERKEKLPFVIGLMSLPGTDLMLMDTVHAVLEASGRPTEVCAGKSLFSSS